MFKKILNKSTKAPYSPVYGYAGKHIHQPIEKDPLTHDGQLPARWWNRCQSDVLSQIGSTSLRCH